MKKQNSKYGSAMITALIFLMVIMYGLAALIKFQNYNKRMTFRAYDINRARYNAEAGVHLALNELNYKDDITASTQVAFDNHYYSWANVGAGHYRLSNHPYEDGWLNVDVEIDSSTGNAEITSEWHIGNTGFFTDIKKRVFVQSFKGPVDADPNTFLGSVASMSNIVSCLDFVSDSYNNGVYDRDNPGYNGDLLTYNPTGANIELKNKAIVRGKIYTLAGGGGCDVSYYKADHTQDASSGRVFNFKSHEDNIKTDGAGNLTPGGTACEFAHIDTDSNNIWDTDVDTANGETNADADGICTVCGGHVHRDANADGRCDFTDALIAQCDGKLSNAIAIPNPSPVYPAMVPAHLLFTGTALTLSAGSNGSGYYAGTTSAGINSATFTGGFYHINGNLQFKNNQTLTIQSDSDIFVEGDLIVEELINYTVASGVVDEVYQVRFYVGGDITFSQGSDIGGTSNVSASFTALQKYDARKLKIYGVAPLSSSATATIGNDGFFVGTIYAPNYNFLINTNSEVFGALVAHLITPNNGAQIHFDERLSGNANGDNEDLYAISAWRNY